MYKTKGFQKRSLEEIYKDIDSLALENNELRKVFLADGDALVLDTSFLMDILKYLQKSFIKLSRVSLYATTQNIQNKSSDDLLLLKQNKLNLFYIGIESGNDTILKNITKGVNSLEIIDALNKTSAANIKISATVILGIGGVVYSSLHAKATANIINNTSVNYLSTLQVNLHESIQNEFITKFPEFIALNDYEMLSEQRNFLEQLDPKNKVIFRSNHVSNTLALEGIIPRDINKLIQQIDEVNKRQDNPIIPTKYMGF